MDQSEDAFKFTKSIQWNDKGIILHILARPSEDVLASAYLQFKHQGRADLIWHQGDIPSITDFLAWGTRPNNWIYSCMVQKIGSDVINQVGLGWSTQITPVGPTTFKAEVGMGFFRECPVDAPQEFCEMCIDHGFETLNLISMYGTTPVPNRVAIAFHKKVGFREVGVFPYYTSWQRVPCDALITVMTREDWESNRKQVE